MKKNSQHIKNYKALMDSSKGIMDLFKQSLNELSYLEIDDIKHNYDQLYDLYYTVDGINQDIYDQFLNHTLVKNVIMKYKIPFSN